MNLFDLKVQHYNLNLDYHKYNIDDETQTNYLIQKQINSFLNSYKENCDKVFILEYQDDTISLICYNLLRIINSITDFKFYICGKRHKTKKYLKKIKTISKTKKDHLLKKEKAVLISAFNPIYQVIDYNKVFKNFDYRYRLSPMIQFTPIEIEQTKSFYNIGDIKNDILNSPIVENYKNWISEKPTFENNTFEYYLPFISKEYKEQQIHLIKLSSDLTHNSEILNELENANGLFFYYIPDNLEKQDLDKLKQQLYEFSFYIKNNSNICGYYNVNIDANEIANNFSADIIVHK